MKKIFKRISLALTLAISVVCLCSFTSACGEEQSATYTVTVVYADGSPVDGTQGKDGEQMTVQICTAKMNGALISCFYTFNVGSDGKATIDKWPELQQNVQYHIQLNNYDDTTYTYDENATFMTAKGNLKITLRAKAN